MSQVVIKNPIVNSPPRIERPRDNQPNPFVDFDGGPSDFDRRSTSTTTSKVGPTIS